MIGLFSNECTFEFRICSLHKIIHSKKLTSLSELKKECGMNNTKGFTLIELLVVVAIVGVLASVGIPTYTRMVAKSRRAEARVGLGSVFTATTAFQAEYGGFGNNMGRIGADISDTRNYAIGFPAGASGTVTCADDVAKPRPDVGAGIRVAQDYPPYYVGIADTVDNSANIGNCYVGPTGTMDNGGVVFLATASGCIAPRLDNNCAAGEQDVWTIDPNRALVLFQDGVP